MADPGHHDVIDPRVRLLVSFAGNNADRRPARLLRSAGRCGHHLSAPTAHERRAPLREEPSHLSTSLLVLDPAAHDGDLQRAHRPIVLP
jgi:hypothetical protein